MEKYISKDILKSKKFNFDCECKQDNGMTPIN